ncbi:MAG TPA: OadG family protein [Clostridia bacterium]|nr:OadG family protein [Clostridia bacterium]
MSVVESVVVGLFCLFIVFLVLAVLYGMVILLSVVLRAVTGKNNADGHTEDPESAIENAAGTENANDQQTSNGKLELLNVDDKTAAAIMAIVSHESGIPLDELNFKYIKALE